MDEIHRFASTQWKQLLSNNKFKYSIGLTATIERIDGEEEFLQEHIGKIAYEYTTSNAVKDGMLNKFTITNYGIDLPQKEKEYLMRLDRDIKRNMNRFQNDLSRVVQAVKNRNRYAGITLSLISKRKRFYNNSIPKVNKAVQIIKSLLVTKQSTNISTYNMLFNTYVSSKEQSTNKTLYTNKVLGNKIIVFGEYIETADLLHTKLKKNGISSWVYYSGNKKSKFKFNAKEKREILECFRKCTSGILITVKALDEGLNIPDLEHGIILGYNKTDRQAIQRLGRIIRKQDNKSPTLVNLYYRGTQDYFNAKNFSDLFSEAGEVEWK